MMSGNTTGSWTSGSNSKPWPMIPFTIAGHSKYSKYRWIYVIGGVPNGKLATDKVQCWEPGIDSWEMRAPIPIETKCTNAVTFKNCIYVAVSGQSPTYGLLGKNFYLKPDIAEYPDDILWKHNGSKVVEFNGKEETVYGFYQGRVTLDWINAELNMTDLRYEDSGEYELETYKNKELRTRYYKLEVIDKVTNPTISCDMTDGKSDEHGTKATLMCSANPTRPQSLMKLEWVGNVQSGPNLTITLEGEDDDKKYTCRVSNPLTSATATFIAKDCYSGGSSTAALAVSLSIIILIALALVVGGILFCKKTRKACFGEKNGDDVETPLPGGEKGESDKETTPENESRPLLSREATLPSSQQLRHLGQNNENLKPDVPLSDPKEDTDAHLVKGRVQELKRKFEPGEGEQTLPPDTHTESKESEEEHSPPANGMSPPTAQPHLSLTQNSPDKETKDTADEHKEDAQSDQVNEETSGKNVRESDSAGSEQRNESDETSEEKQSPTVSEQNSSETALHEQKSKLSGEEKHTREDDQQQVYTAGSEGKSDAGSEGESPTPHADQKTGIKTRHDLDEPGSSTADAGQVEHEVGIAEKSEGRVQEPKRKFEPGEGEQTLPPDAQTVSDKNKEEHSPPANGMSPPTAQPRSTLTQNSPDKGTKDTADEHKEDAQSDQVNEETSEKNVTESDSAGSEQRNESDNSSVEKESSTVPEQNSSETALHEQKSKSSMEETQTMTKDDQLKMNREGSEDKSEAGSEGESPTQTEPDNTKTKTFQESVNTPHAHQETGIKTRHVQELKKKFEQGEGEKTLPPDAQTGVGTSKKN
ncbi:lymphocyte function-associated antigen 3 isoform X1 [Toxotes jaculatrix]|uniref:lymphocyte function-associated antigen 3 isoform X1 n=1 Tax=Toxotes jaculatrix TaxID=941984 RepID=UPI001B3A94F9|nr:lymphocyte function-associated antigen 3 isoform X1 [Toxotes jaculatrix]